MTEDRGKWRKYVHGVANPQIEDGWGNRTTVEQNQKLLLWFVEFTRWRLVGSVKCKCQKYALLICFLWINCSISDLLPVAIARTSDVTEIF